MRTLKRTYFAPILTLFMAYGVASAQTKPTASADELKQSSANMVEASREYQARSEELVQIQETAVNQATAKLDELRQLVADGLVAKAELEQSEQSLATLRGQLEMTRKQILDSREMVIRIRADEAKAQAAAVSARTTAKTSGASLTRPTLFRYNGPTAWSVGNLTQVQSFFYSTFGRSLPTSAVGQSATHNRLGYDHRNAVDVALHPDSSEGRALVNYLQNHGIPFLAFRAAVPGVATGPHIHIGSPSHRI